VSTQNEKLRDSWRYDAVREFWNARESKEFDSRTRRSGRMGAINRVAALAKPYLSREGAVSIDLGCGTGLFAEAVGVRSIIGVDFSSSLLAVARRRMDTVWHQNIFDLRLAEISVDNVVSLFVIDDYPSDKKRSFLGCKFHTRCHKYIGDICRDSEPNLTTLSATRKVACHLYPS
jgi:2-polyprenyl-3-methyl-5-hydroxy-6-metoxy-1,4-benzoquinol methylase